jgi:hypothetical protein
MHGPVCCAGFSPVLVHGNAFPFLRPSQNYSLHLLREAQSQPLGTARGRPRCGKASLLPFSGRSVVSALSP